MNLMMLLLLLLLFIESVYSAINACFHPDGSNITTNYPCFSSGDSPCCAKGYACLKNGLCKWTSAAGNSPPDNSEYVRGSCTDQSWKSPSCPKYCITPSLDIVDGGEYMMQCPEGNFYFCNNTLGSIETNCTQGAMAYTWAREYRSSSSDFT
jgi:hypothetical protein